MDGRTEKWIKDAFERANPGMNGRNIQEFSMESHDDFAKIFPAIAYSFSEAYGPDAAIKILEITAKEPMVLKALEVCFGTGMITARIKDKIENGEEEENRFRFTQDHATLLSDLIEQSDGERKKALVSLYKQLRRFRQEP